MGIERRWETVVFIIMFHLDAFAAKLPFSPRGHIPCGGCESDRLSLKCVIIVSFGAAHLPGWPLDLLYLLRAPWWLWRDQTSHSCRVSKQQPAAWTAVATCHRACHIGITSCRPSRDEKHWKQMTASGRKASLTHMRVPLAGLSSALPRISLASSPHRNC